VSLHHLPTCKRWIYLFFVSLLRGTSRNKSVSGPVFFDEILCSTTPSLQKNIPLLLLGLGLSQCPGYPIKCWQGVMMVMNQVQGRSEKKRFEYQDFVLWYYRSGNRSLPIPGVVVRQEANTVIIRARVEGVLKEFAVDADQLIER
jgi:hypothetical protein